MDLHIIHCIIGLLITCNLSAQRDCVVRKYEAQVGIQETGNNRGKKIEQFQKSTGIKPGMAWCASMVYWCHSECDVKLNIKNPAQAKSWFPKDKIICRSGRESKKPRKGDVIGTSWKSGINHAGFYEKSDDRSYYTVEGNTSKGVARLKRLKKTVTISRWIK